jgi:hypothetical protein
MTLGSLTLDEWRRMSDQCAISECVALARRVHGLRFLDLSPNENSRRFCRVARFALGEDIFVLVPGGEAHLGFDGYSFEPLEHQARSFADSAEAIGYGLSLQNFIDERTSKPRTAAVSPMLMEVEAQDLSSESVEPDDPILKPLQNELAGFARSGAARHSINFLDEGDTYVIERGADGNIWVWRQPGRTHADVMAEIERSGARLPSCDEWEYACGAGSAGLFRWGDDCPTSFGPLDAPARDWLRPNLFGLRIAENPYHMDLVSDGLLALGGDGGCTCCGGYGKFVQWLTLASAHRDPYQAEWFSPDEPIFYDNCRIRRVISVN